MKKCKDCCVLKDLKEFHKSKTNFGGVISYCKTCQKIRAHKYYLNNKTKIAKQNLDYQRKTPEKRINYSLFQRYRIQEKDYNELLTKQNGSCAICKEFRLTKGKLRLCIDHCHKTGKIRGLLCDNCNKAVGLLKDDLNLIIQAGKYFCEHGDV